MSHQQRLNRNLSESPQDEANADSGEGAGAGSNANNKVRTLIILVKECILELYACKCLDQKVSHSR